MTTTAASDSPTPQWDSRNLGFVPPAQYQLLRQSSPLGREISSTSDRPRSMADSLPSQQALSSLRPSLTTTSHSHSRSTSFFSFLKSTDNSPATLPSSRAEPGLQRQQSRPSPVDEEGRRVLVKPHTSSPSLRNNTNSSVPSPEQSQSQTPTPQPSQPPQPTSQPSQLHPEIVSVVKLTHAHAHKIYMSGPLVRRIERLPDGHQPIKDDGWRDVWAQLGGTTLSIWDMTEIEEASKEGKEVPPTYVNITDAVSDLYHLSWYYLSDNHR
jgi:CCR4-NOT transcriptional complex subunit CAF120